MSFQQSHSVGKQAESLVQRLLEVAGIASTLNTDRKSLAEWDIKAELYSIPFTIECKFDVMACQTGNLAIEYYNTRLAKPSGILATKSTVWAVALANKKVYFANTSVLRQYFKTVKPFREISSGGDNNSAMKLFRAATILPAVFRRMDTLAPDAFITELVVLLGEPFIEAHKRRSLA